jgi:hypothetical protein
MRSVLLLLLPLMMPGVALSERRFTAPPDVPAATPNPEYPVHARIVQSHWNYVNGGYEGYGRGNILGDKPVGFDYTYSCSEPFLHNAQAAEFYQARWKKQDQRLELLMQKVGTDHQQKCELKVALKAAPYGAAAAAVVAAPAAPPSAKPN